MFVKDFALRLNGTVFGIVAILHLLRVITSIPILIASWMLPMWFSYVGFLATGVLSGWLWMLSYGGSVGTSKYLTDKHRYH